MGLYTLTTRAAGTVLTGLGSSSDIFNVDHQNHVTHTAAAFLNSWEESLTQMNLEANPAPGNVVSLPSALSDEFERIRFVLSDMKAAISAGTPPDHWYTETDTFADFISFPTTAARLELNGVQSVISGSELINVLFDTTVYATVPGMVGPKATLPGTLIAPATGVYIVGACLPFGDGISTGPTGDMKLTLRRLGPAPVTAADLLSPTTAIAVDQVYSGATAMPKTIVVETIAKFTAGQALMAFAFQSSGSSQTITTNATLRPALWMAMIGRLS